MSKLLLLIFLCLNLQSDSLNNIDISLDHHGKVLRISDNFDDYINFNQEDIKNTPEFSSQLLEKQFNRLSKFVPEGTVIALSANRNGVVTSISNTKKRPVLSLSHTDFEDHFHPESTLMTNLNLNIAMDSNQNSIFLYIKSNKKLIPLNKVISN
jgi:hypothetical protein